MRDGLPSIPREARIEAMRRIYEATGAGTSTFAWSSSELIRYLASGLATGGGPGWPSREGAANRWLARAARSSVVRAGLRVGLSSALRRQRGRIGRRAWTSLDGAVLPAGRPCRVFLVFGAANEERILAWRDRLVPLPTVRLTSSPTATDAHRLPRAAGAEAAELHERLETDVARAGEALGAVGAAAPPAARSVLWKRADAFLATLRTLDRIHAVSPIREVLTSSLDERAFAGAHWAAQHPGTEAHWVQHGFLALDVLPWLPGAVHHAFDEAHGVLARACGAPAIAVAPPLGTAYFPASSYAPTPTLLLASQARIPFSLPIGRGVEAAYERVVRAALAAGWSVVQRPHRVEEEGSFPRHELAGVVPDRGTGDFGARLQAVRPTYVLSVWSTAALDALAAGCRPLFVLSRAGMVEHSVSDLSRFGTVLDPAHPDFERRVEALFVPRGAASATPGAPRGAGAGA